jgi:hypothetical protein
MMQTASLPDDAAGLQPVSMRMSSSSGARASLAEFAILFVLALAVYVISLRFVFPGYFDPLWPHHNDFYMPLARAAAPGAVLGYLTGTRPTGFLFSWATGYLGLHGAILCTIIITLINTAGTAFVFRRVSGLSWGWIYAFGALLYFGLAFTHPHFYIFYTHNMWDQLAYLLLLAGYGLYFRFWHRAPVLLAAACVLFFIIAFKAKETYGPPALIIFAAFILARYWQVRSLSAVRGHLAVLVILTASLLVSLAYARYVGSSFVSGGDASSSYRIDASPASVAQEWLRYAKGGFKWSSLALVLAGVAAAWLMNWRIGLAALACLLAGTSAWLPNALLPNHYFSGYSWNGAYLYLLGVIPLVVLFGRLYKGLVVVPFLLAPAVVYESQAEYAKNQWTLDQEASQRRMWQGIERVLEEQGTRSRNVLVTGIILPFSPFFMPNAMSYVAPDIHFDVVDYAGLRSSVGTEQVRFVPPTDVWLEDYAEVWIIHPDGSVSAAEVTAELARTGGAAWLDKVLYPAAADVLPSGGTEVPQVTAYLKCAQAYTVYRATARAEECLSAAMSRYPNNPYPYFQAGKLAEASGRKDDALRYYQLAIDKDDPKARNPFFAQARDKLAR